MPERMLLSSAPTGIRTPVVALKGLRPSPLDDGGKLCTERADFIIPSCNGQAFSLFFLFRALTKQRQDIHLFAIDQNTRAFCLKVGNQDRRKDCFINRDEISAFIRDHYGEIKTACHLDFAFDLIDVRGKPGWHGSDVAVPAALKLIRTQVLAPSRADRKYL